MVGETLALARDWGADLAGWAALDRGELRLYSLLSAPEAARYRSAFVVAKAHDAAVLANPRMLPSALYDQDYRRLNSELDQLISRLEDFIKGQGVACQAVPASRTLDEVHQRGLVSHRALAQRAGLGVRGRNNLLVTVPFRSGVRLASILTEVRIPRVPEMVVPYPCVQCNKCREACPAAALGENPSDFRLDRCMGYLERVHPESLSPQTCGICLAVCSGIEPKTK